MTSTVKKAENIRDVIRYLQKFKNAVVVIYLDDKTIYSPLFSTHIRDIALLHQAGLQVAIVPGARRRIDEILASSNIKWNYKDEVRVTLDDAMPLIKMAAFDVSNTVMTSLAANNITAIIGNWVHARAKGVLEGFDYGTAGEIDRLQTDSVKAVLDNGFIPIFPCIGWNSVGHPYNISSIALAKQIAVALKADKLFFVMEDGGISAEKYKIPEQIAVSEDGEVPALTVEEVDLFLKTLDEKAANCEATAAFDECTPVQENRSLEVLLKTARDACKNGVTRAHIVDGKLNGVLLSEIFSDLGSGTMIYTSNYGKIRSMLQTDIPSVLGLIRPFVESGKLLPRTEQNFAENLGDYVVYEVDGGVHACASLHLYDDGQAEIGAVAVDENFTHMGIGPKIMDFLLEKSKSLGAKSVFIMTTQSADWFEKLGFVQDKIESIPAARKSIWTPERNSKVYRLN